MAVLTDRQKLYLVTRLACFLTPSEILKAAKLDLNLTLTTSQICTYDPTTVSGERMSEGLKKIFAETRKRFLEDEAAIPISHRAYRLSRMQRIIDDPTFGRNPTLVCNVMEQAAREMGGAYNARKAEKQGETSDPNAIPEALESAVSKVYGADPGPGSPDSGPISAE